jgi:hypothetical protein
LRDNGNAGVPGTGDHRDEPGVPGTEACQQRFTVLVAEVVDDVDEE